MHGPRRPTPSKTDRWSPTGGGRCRAIPSGRRPTNCVGVLGELTGGDDALVHDVSDHKMAPGQGEELPQSHHVEDGTTCGYEKMGGFLSEGKKVCRWNIVGVACGETGIDNMNDDFQHIVAQTGKDTVRYPIVVWGAGFGVRQEFSQKTHGDHRAGHR